MKIVTFSYKNVHLKLSLFKYWLFCSEAKNESKQGFIPLLYRVWLKWAGDPWDNWMNEKHTHTPAQVHQSSCAPLHDLVVTVVLVMNMAS